MEYLNKQGYDSGALHEDYISNPPISPAGVSRNHEIITKALDPNNQEFKDFLYNNSEQLYVEGRTAAENTKEELYQILKVDQHVSLEDLKDKLVSEGAKKDDPKLKLIEDLLYFKKIDQMDHSETPNQGERLDVSVKGMFFSKLKREENEIQTAKEIWHRFF